MNINRLVITGNVTADPDLRSTTAGTAVARLRLAVNTRRKNGSTGEWEAKPNYFDVIDWGAQAENCERYLRKGRPVAVDGRLEWCEYRAKDGSTVGPLRSSPRASSSSDRPPTPKPDPRQKRRKHATGRRRSCPPRFARTRSRFDPMREHDADQATRRSEIGDCAPTNQSTIFDHERPGWLQIAANAPEKHADGNLKPPVSRETVRRPARPGRPARRRVVIPASLKRGWCFLDLGGPPHRDGAAVVEMNSARSYSPGDSAFANGPGQAPQQSWTTALIDISGPRLLPCPDLKLVRLGERG